MDSVTNSRCIRGQRLVSLQEQDDLKWRPDCNESARCDLDGTQEVNVFWTTTMQSAMSLARRYQQRNYLKKMRKED